MIENKISGIVYNKKAHFKKCTFFMNYSQKPDRMSQQFTDIMFDIFYFLMTFNVLVSSFELTLTK